MNYKGQSSFGSRGLENRKITAKEVLNSARESPGKVKEIDEMKATIEHAFQARIPHWKNSELIKEAHKLNNKLFKPEAEVGRREKSAIADTLIKMYQEMDRRLQEATGKKAGLPKMEGVTWNPDDPLAGIVEGISPFQMIDWWQTYSNLEEQVITKKRRQRISYLRPQTIHRQDEAFKLKRPKFKPPPSTRRREIMRKIIGKPKKFGPDKKKWWKNPSSSLYKAVGMLFSNWINAIGAGIEESARSFSLVFVAEGIASMAKKISDNPIRRVIDPESGLPIYLYDPIPKPDDSRIVPILIDRIKKWEYPSDMKAFKIGQERGLKFAEKIILDLENKYSGGGVRYLLYLKQRFNGNQVAIHNHILKEIKKAGIRK